MRMLCATQWEVVGGGSVSCEGEEEFINDEERSKSPSLRHRHIYKT